jgi:hypothetical protein
MQSIKEVLSAQFPNTRERRNDFNLIWETMVNSNLILPNLDHTICKTRGLNTGSQFTSLVGSLANAGYQYWSYIEYFRKYPDDYKVLVLGDDTIIGLKYKGLTDIEAEAKARLYMASSARRLRRYFNVSISPEKSDVNAMFFLGCKRSGNSRWRDPRIVISKMIFPERIRYKTWIRDKDRKVPLDDVARIKHIYAHLIAISY